ncbi:uncharacterized protein LOC123873305 [Maniola jurtina]|uniref:uncharacterized protein LOC123873305 n=1 Tax=Maniola jurtina TaxID=191418 RepID=UPI001E68DCA1|nr:uncharacterized protein LOC123873305 [Maniola jurtina]
MAEVHQVVVVTERIKVKPKNSREIILKKCCCVVPLRTGCLILAYLYLIFTVGIGFVYIKELVSLVVNTIIPKAPEDYPRFTIGLLVFYSISMALALIAIPFNIHLISGLHSERRSFLVIYVKFQLTNFTLSIFVDVVTMAMGNYWSPAGAVVTMIAYFWYNLYYLIVVKSLYLKMGEAANNLPGQRGHDVAVAT